MRLFTKQGLSFLCIVFLLNITEIFARSKFEHYHTISLKSTPIKLDDASYEDLTSTLRNYTTVVLLTAQDIRFGCHLCRDFEPEWNVIAKSWIRGDKRGRTRVLYATLDFADGKETYQKVIYAIPHALSIDKWSECCVLVVITNSSIVAYTSTKYGPKCKARWTACAL